MQIAGGNSCPVISATDTEKKAKCEALSEIKRPSGPNPADHMKKVALTAKCPDCDADIDIGNAQEHEVLSCPSCALEFEVKKEKGVISLQELVIEGEDWGE